MCLTDQDILGGGCSTSLAGLAMVFVPSSCFSTLLSTRDLFLGATHRKILHLLVHKVIYGTPFIAVTGVSGIGKTVLLRAARNILSQQGLHAIEPATAPIRPKELHRAILEALAPGTP